MGSVLDQILEEKIVAVVRSPDPARLVEVAEALHAGGVRCMEITLTVPRALEVIAAVAARLKDQIILGAGTVLDAETARACLLQGAQFIVSPIVDEGVIRLCRRYSAVVFPGAFTPTEIVRAWEWGGDIIKVFPADVGGPGYFKALRGPLPQVRLMPTGGVDLTTARAFLDAGACCLGVGSALVEPDAIARGDMERISDLARQYVELVHSDR